MIDPIISLAFSIYSNPRVYALLIGSGVSRSAKIPTGWEITTDLIRRTAAAEGGNADPDPENWYSQKYGEEPEYSQLLLRLGHTPAERAALLRSYFEASEEDFQEGVKAPTAAHKAIAQLVKDGMIKIILTTNFDRLLETAIEAEGVTPDVISSDDALKGAMPYVHSRCTILKLHGDYRDTRIKNTPKELAAYTVSMNALLDRILDEFGLIVGGWSAEWDAALREAILRCPSRRFTTYWLKKGDLTDDAKRLVEHRKAQVIEINDADTFFPNLADMVESMEESDQPHPLSTVEAINSVKRYLSEPKFSIKLQDLILGEANRIVGQLSSSDYDPHEQLVAESFQRRIHKLEALSERLASMMMTLAAYDSRSEKVELQRRAVESSASLQERDGLVVWSRLQFYPALLTVYAAGVVALHSENYAHLAGLLIDPKHTNRDGRRASALGIINPVSVFSSGADKLVPRPNANREFTPANNYMADVVYGWSKSFFSDRQRFEQALDLFEYLLGLVYIDVVGNGDTYVWAPVGRFHWKHRHAFNQSNPINDFLNDNISKGILSPLLANRFFDGSVDRLKDAISKYQQFLLGINWF